jgi:hypothetical protein
MGSSRHASNASPSVVIRVHTVRRSLLSREREIKDRFSSRSSTRVISESRVTIRFPISPHGSPSGEPRRIRSTLYCVEERSWDFSTCANRCDSASIARIISRYVTSSGQGVGFRLRSAWTTVFIYDLNNTRCNDHCQTEDSGVGKGSNYGTRLLRAAPVDRGHLHYDSMIRYNALRRSKDLCFHLRSARYPPDSSPLRAFASVSMGRVQTKRRLARASTRTSWLSNKRASTWIHVLARQQAITV